MLVFDIVTTLVTMSVPRNKSSRYLLLYIVLYCPSEPSLRRTIYYIITTIVAEDHRMLDCTSSSGTKRNIVDLYHARKYLPIQPFFVSCHLLLPPPFAVPLVARTPPCQDSLRSYDLLLNLL